MTVSHADTVVRVDSLDAAVGVLRARGHRVSAARRLVLEALFTADRPVTAEEIAAGLDGALPTSDLASVYRNLDVLEQAGLVRHVHLGHGPGQYAVSREGDREHLLCERCGASLSVDAAVLADVHVAIRAATGFEARFGHFPIVGLCPACVARQEADGDSNGGAPRC